MNKLAAYCLEIPRLVSLVALDTASNLNLLSNTNLLASENHGMLQTALVAFRRLDHSKENSLSPLSTCHPKADPDSI